MTAPPRRRNIHGVSIGILMLETYFERFNGDIGNAKTWPFPVHYRIVKGASPNLITSLTGLEMLEPFKQAADDLVALGVDGITTSCGFLALYQQELAAHCSVPVATSALLQVQMVARILPHGKRPAILTFSAETLTARHLECAGADPTTPIFGMPTTSRFQQSIRTGDISVSFETLREEVLTLAEQTLASDPTIGAFVFECTNLTPYSRDVARATGLPVFDMVTLVHWFQRSLNPQAFTQND